MSVNTIPANFQQDLAKHAIAIRDLGKRAVENVIEIGRRLTEAKPLAGHGGFLPWLKREFGWTERTAQNFMRVYELSKTKRISDLNIPLAGLYLLAAPSTPEKVCDEVITRAEAGKDVSASEIREAVAEQKAVDADEPADETEDQLAGEEVETTDDELEDELEDEDEDEDEDSTDDDDDDDAGDDHLAEKLRAAELKIIGLESEVGELKSERDQLRARVAELEGVIKNSTVAKKKRGWPKGKKRKPTAATEPAQAGAPIASSSVIENSTAVENATAPAPNVDDADLQSRSTALVDNYANPGPIPEFCRRAS